MKQDIIKAIINKRDNKENDLELLENQKTILRQEMANPTDININALDIKTVTREAGVINDGLTYALELDKIDSMKDFLKKFEEDVNGMVQSSEQEGEDSTELKEELKVIKKWRAEEESNLINENEQSDLGNSKRESNLIDKSEQSGKRKRDEEENFSSKRTKQSTELPDDLPYNPFDDIGID